MIFLLLTTLSAWTVVFVAGHNVSLISNRISIGIIGFGLLVLGVVGAASNYTTVSDRGVYLDYFTSASRASSLRELNIDSDPLFVAFLWVMGQVLPATPTVLFGVVATFFAGSYTFSASRLGGSLCGLLSFFTILCSGWFLSYTTVAVRQGLAIACLIAAVPFVVRTGGRRHWFLILTGSAALMHWSAIVPALVLIALAVRTPPLRFVVLGWSILAVAYVAGAQQLILGGAAQRLPSVGEFTESQAYSNYGGLGNRLDFLAVSLLIGIGAIAAFRLVQTPELEKLVIIYLLFNSFFLLFGFVAFSDRIAAYSWTLGPILLWYTLITKGSKATMLVALGLVIAFGFFAGTLSAFG